MKYLHTMVRVSDLESSLDFYCNKLGLEDLRRYDNEPAHIALVFLAALGDETGQVELIYNWDPEDHAKGRDFSHPAYAVDDIYALCQRLFYHGVTIARPPRDDRIAFFRSPDNISSELLRQGEPISPAEPWLSMENSGHW